MVYKNVQPMNTRRKEPKRTACLSLTIFLTRKGSARDIFPSAEEIKAGTAANYTDRRALAVDYDKPVRRYQYKQFSLTTNIEA